jgi:hypothetical protein
MFQKSKPHPDEEVDIWKSWSLRRTAVYQKFSYDEADSTWITLYPSARIEQRVQESLVAQSRRQGTKRAQKSLETHLVLISSTAENWRPYYNSLDQFFEEKVCN